MFSKYVNGDTKKKRQHASLIKMITSKKEMVEYPKKGKGYKRGCANYRGISILNIPGKIYGRVMISRVMKSTKEQEMEEQGGFRSGRG